MNVKTIVWMISGGHCFRDLRVLQTAIEKKGRLPNDYFYREENFCNETWRAKWRSKKELKEIREEIINEIIQVINSQNNVPYTDKMEADHYARYLHALAILKVDKSILRDTADDHFRNAFLALWQIDDGSEEVWETIRRVAYYMSEATQKLRGKKVRGEISYSGPIW